METNDVRPRLAIKLLTIREVSQMTGWPVNSILEKVWNRQIEFVPFGGSVRFRLSTILALIEKEKAPEPTEQ